MNEDIQLDARSLPPPEPMERVLELLPQIDDGKRLRLLIDREPLPLFRILESEQFEYSIRKQPDYSYEVMIWKKG
ncbi:MAG: DUF2249 domain-containing protein [Alcaligenaceae bacterium]|nr:DUF2249 domain-containing protein [Alcaligenaceae bacterium]